MILKWILDRLVSLIGLLVLWPVLVVIAILVRAKMPGGPVIFKQKRVGHHGKLFTMYKFRSMTANHSGSSVSVKGERRITLWGAKLRKYKLDELPELWNIFKGDMSIVGPRPLLVQYLPLYNERQRHRHDVRPGLTGWAQVHGRNSISWEEKFNWDVKYVNEISFLNDCRIILQTVSAVLRREGINSADDATMPDFTGNGDS